jgi:hypothetical protein
MAEMGTTLRPRRDGGAPGYPARRSVRVRGTAGLARLARFAATAATLCLVHLERGLYRDEAVADEPGAPEPDREGGADGSWGEAPCPPDATEPCSKPWYWTGG